MPYFWTFTSPFFFVNLPSASDFHPSFIAFFIVSFFVFCILSSSPTSLLRFVSHSSLPSVFIAHFRFAFYTLSPPHVLAAKLPLCLS